MDRSGEESNGLLTPATASARSHSAAPQPAETAGSSFDPRLAEISSRYQLLGIAGQGGMGVVYRARDRETGDELAIKVLKPEIASDPALVERFKNELRLSRRVTHKNVCRIHDFHRSDNVSFITMEFVEGETLRDLLNRKLDISDAMEYALQICDGMAEAHSKGIIHRDLKPENVMVGKSGLVKIMDFGIARALESRVTLTGTLIGTPAYMSPEQAEGKAIDMRSDVYTLGLLLYEMFTGTAAFDAETPIALALKQIKEPPQSPRAMEPSVSPRLAETILKCLEKNPQHRFSSVQDLRSALALEMATAARTKGRRHKTSHLITPSTDLPPMPRSRVRLLLVLIQLMYLSFYFVALSRMDEIIAIVVREQPILLRSVLTLVVATGLIGIAVRLYLLSAAALDFSGLGDTFHLIFPVLLILDIVWAFSPLFLADKLGLGLALAVVVALLYLPFSHRTLVRIGYGNG